MDKKKASDSEEEAPNAEGSDEGSHSQAWDKDGTINENDSVSKADSNVSSKGALCVLESSEDEKKLSSQKAIKKGNRSKDASSSCHHSKNSEHRKAGTFKFKDRHFVLLASFQLKFVSMAIAAQARPVQVPVWWAEHCSPQATATTRWTPFIDGACSS